MDPHFTDIDGVEIFEGDEVRAYTTQDDFVLGRVESLTFDVDVEDGVAVDASYATVTLYPSRRVIQVRPDGMHTEFDIVKE